MCNAKFNLRHYSDLKYISNNDSTKSRFVGICCVSRSSSLLAIAKTCIDVSSVCIGNIHIRMSADGYILYFTQMRLLVQYISYS